MRRIFLVPATLGLVLLTAAGHAETKKIGDMTVYVGENGKSSKHEKYANTTYWVERSHSDAIQKEVRERTRGEIYVRNDAAAAEARKKSNAR